MWKLSVAIALACFVTPAFADDCSGQAKRTLTLAPQEKLQVLADFKVTGAPYDREIILGHGAGVESIWFFAKGCLLNTHPIMLGPQAALGAAPAAEPAAPAGPAPVIPPAPPKPRGGGMEIGA